MYKLAERIQLFNQGRDPQLLQLKYKAMQNDVFAFFRGTCHLFYEDWPTHTSLDSAPSAWICGDLHLENLGSYKADNRHVYFNINDFDESAQAPCTWDLARFVTGLLVSTRMLDIHDAEALPLCTSFLDTYRDVLAKGHARMLQEDEVTGYVKELFFNLKTRQRKDFLDTRTKQMGKGGMRELHWKHFLPITDVAERADATAALDAWRAKQPNSEFFKVLDVAHRIAGIGSLGQRRYVFLVEGDGSPDHNYLLDLKESDPSSLQPYLKLSQPQWSSQAERIISIQRWVQEMPPTLLATVELNGKFYVLRELQPTEDKVELEQLGGKLDRLKEVATMIAKVIAWDQLHSAGHNGSATASELMDFAQVSHWQDVLLKYAQYYATQVEEDYREFRAAFESGFFAQGH